MMTKNQKTGLVLLIGSLLMLFIPPAILGTPVPAELYFPLAMFAMIFMILGMVLLAKVFD